MVSVPETDAWLEQTQTGLTPHPRDNLIHRFRVTNIDACLLIESSSTKNNEPPLIRDFRQMMVVDEIHGGLAGCCTN